MKTIAIHQPNFIPWIGYFAKILAADEFIFLDTPQFSKGSYQNRVQIKTPQGSTWLTANVKKEKESFVPSNIVKLADFDRWKVKHLKTIQANYSKSTNFSFFYEQLTDFYENSDFEYLCDFNIGLILLCCETLGIKTNGFVRSSELPLSGSNDDALVEICKLHGADTYISGSGGRNYQDDKKFSDNGICVSYDFFNHPSYNQLWGAFENGLSILDLLFNEGPAAKVILRNSINESN